MGATRTRSRRAGRGRSRKVGAVLSRCLGLSFEKRQGGLAQLRAGNALIDIVPADDAESAGGA
jgi:hypothetical protein